MARRSTFYEDRKLQKQLLSLLEAPSSQRETPLEERRLKLALPATLSLWPV